MKASKLLEEIKENLKDFNIEYVRNKVTDDRYKDPLTKKLAKYNSEIYDEIFEIKLKEDICISDKKVKDLKNDIDYYFSKYNPHDPENNKLTKYLCLYLSFIGKKPLHPIDNDEVYKRENEFYCKSKSKYIKERNTLCKYCCAKIAPFNHFF